MSDLYLTCAIKWIDCDGKETPDNNPAIGFAVHDGDGYRYPICEEHKRTVLVHTVHHDIKCTHYPRDGKSSWTFVPYTDAERAEQTWMETGAYARAAADAIDARDGAPEALERLANVCFRLYGVASAAGHAALGNAEAIRDVTRNAYEHGWAQERAKAWRLWAVTNARGTVWPG